MPYNPYVAYPQQPFTVQQPTYPMYSQTYQTQPMQQPQPQAQPVQRPFNGRVVQSIDQITVADVPGDGTPAYFPLADHSAIISKSWTTDGLIDTVRYVPEPKDAPQPQSQADTETQGKILERLDSMEQTLRTLTKSLTE